MARTRTVQLDIPAQLRDQVRPGAKLRVFFQPDNINNKVLHVRALVDDVVVVRWWQRSRRRWEYTCESWYYLWLLWKDGNLTVEDS